jgi:hypothetical protein
VLVGVLLMLFTPSPARAAGAEVRIGMPFSGKFANSFSDPASHEVYFKAGDQWSTDLYAPEGTPVIVSAVAYTSTPTFRVEQAGPLGLCDKKSPGNYVKLGVYLGSSRVGQLVYEHLNGLTVKTGDTISSGKTLGTTHWWPYSSCYLVTSASGIHTHFEMGSSTGTACYVGWPLASALTLSDTIGAVGNYTTKKCPDPLPALGFAAAGVRAISTPDGHIQLFEIVGGVLTQTWYSPVNGAVGGWASSQALPAQAVGNVSLIARTGQSVIDLYVRGGDGQIYETWYNWSNGAWGGWAGFAGATVTSDPQAIATSDGHEQVFATVNGVIKQTWWSPVDGAVGGWRSW